MILIRTKLAQLRSNNEPFAKGEEFERPSFEAEDMDISPEPEAETLRPEPEIQTETLPEPVPEGVEQTEDIQLEPFEPLPPAPELEDDFEKVAPLPPTKEKVARTQPEIRVAIWKAIDSNAPLRIAYTTLEGWPSERTVHPDYVYWAGTRRQVLVGWDESRSDWRSFVVNNIREAELGGPKAESEKETQWVSGQ